jgi:hypothetical protein
MRRLAQLETERPIFRANQNIKAIENQRWAFDVSQTARRA